MRSSARASITVATRTKRRAAPGHGRRGRGTFEPLGAQRCGAVHARARVAAIDSLPRSDCAVDACLLCAVRSGAETE